MLKKSSLRRIGIATLTLVLLFLIWLFPNNNTIKENITYIPSHEIPIYLIDNNNYTARTTITQNNDNEKDLIKNIIEIITINSIKSSYIPYGFKPIIPKNTKLIDFEIKNNNLKLNFSKEFLNIKKEDENHLLEALIFSLTEIKNIKNISLYVENKQLEKFKSGTIIPKYLNKSLGINKEYNLSSIKNTTKTTIYYLCKNKNLHYFVPVTKITNHKEERVEVIIKELKTTPIYETNLISYLATNTNLTNYELLENKISLSFDNYLLANLNNKDILEEVKYSIALSLRDTYNIKQVSFNILNEIETFNL